MMKKALSLVLATTTLLSTAAQAIVIYGDDHRQEVFEASPFHQKLARSAATMISNTKKTINADGTVDFTQETFREWLESQINQEEKEKRLSQKIIQATQNNVTFCESERFTEQPNPGMCSGFLIAPDLIVTAGHCVTLDNFCQEYEWVFDYKVDEKTGSAGLGMSPDNVYKCKQVVSGSLSMALGHDYAVIQLDRLVQDREPLEIRKDGMIEDNTSLVVVGSPSGLPLKVAAGAKVRRNIHPFYFSANLDTFQGNSGSAVFNAETGVVEGILVRGEDDFGFNPEKLCIEANRCPDDKCRGEDISRMTSIPEVAVAGILEKAAIKGDVSTLLQVATLNTWIDFYGKDRKSPLMKAAGAGQAQAVKLLVEAGADVNLKDMNGDTPLHHLARALKKRNAEALEVLLEAKANLRAKNNRGDTPLKAAMKAGNLRGAIIILKALKDVPKKG